MSSPSAAIEGADAERGEDASRNDDVNSEARYARVVFFSSSSRSNAARVAPRGSPDGFYIASVTRRRERDARARATDAIMIIGSDWIECASTAKNLKN
tara:strand:- start:1243 stop:1536 length:294 start_codon:yes stop_codon:yes gene_type:complete